MVEGDGLAQGIDGAGDLFVGMKAGKSEAGMVVDGDMQGLDAGVGVARGAITGGADAGLLEVAQLLDIEVEEVPGASRS